VNISRPRGRRVLAQRQGATSLQTAIPVIEASASDQRETIMIFAASWANQRPPPQPVPALRAQQHPHPAPAYPHRHQVGTARRPGRRRPLRPAGAGHGHSRPRRRAGLGRSDHAARVLEHGQVRLPDPRLDRPPAPRLSPGKKATSRCRPTARGWGEVRRTRLNGWIAARPAIPYDREIARTWGRLAGNAQHRGRPQPHNDTWVAACCIRSEYRS